MSKLLTKNELNRSELFEDRVMLAADVVDLDYHKENNFENGDQDMFTSSGDWRNPVNMIVMDDESPENTWLDKVVYRSSQGGSFEDRPEEGNGVWRSYFSADLWNAESREHDNPLRGLLGQEMENELEFENEAFMGFDLMIPNETEGTYGFPTDEETIISQWFNWADPESEQGGGAVKWAWGSVMSIVDEDLWISHRSSKTDNMTRTMVYEDLPRGEWIEIKSRIISGDGDGKLVYVVNEEIVYSESGIDVGMGDFDEDGNMVNGHFTHSAGVYAYNRDVESYDEGGPGYDEGQWRNLYYDDLSVLNNDEAGFTTQEAWDAVDPDTTSSPSDF